jgi:fumarate reductase iron-sulfur subunit
MEIILDENRSLELAARAGTLLSTALKALADQAPQLGFKVGCEGGVCGACAVRVNGREVLACSYRLQTGDRIEPLRFSRKKADLAGDSGASERLQRAQAWLMRATEAARPFDGKAGSCILCGSCQSVCPVYEVSDAFLGPYALSRVWRYVADEGEDEKYAHLEAVQKDGIYDCTLCGYCGPVCPQGIDPKADILNLRSRSAVVGFEDPNAAAMGGMNFGFNPNQGF